MLLFKEIPDINKIWEKFKIKFNKDIEDFQNPNKYKTDTENVDEEPIRNIILERLREKEDFVFGTELSKKNDQDGDKENDENDENNEGFLNIQKFFLNLIRSYEISFILLLNESSKKIMKKD